MLATVSVLSAAGFSYVGYKNIHNKNVSINTHKNEVKKIEEQLKSINDDINTKENNLKTLLLENENNLISSKEKVTKLKKQRDDLIRKDSEQKQRISKLTADLTNLKKRI